MRLPVACVVLGRPMLFTGDDTWMSLFPNAFSTSVPFPSFHVWDLDTVDRGVTTVLQQHVWTPGSGPWALVVSHLLGVDHVGHTFGAFNPHMEAKLREVDSIVQRTVAALDDDTLLVIVSDHGV